MNKIILRTTICLFIPFSFTGCYYEKEKIDIETSGNIKTIGIIKEEENKIYFEPSEILNIKLIYNSEPEIFNGIEKIYLYSDDVDNIIKNEYLNKDVTIDGIIQNYRGAGNLYLYITKIIEGTEISKTYAYTLDDDSENGEDKQENSNVADIMKPIIENGVYKYNPYLLSKNTIEGMGNEFVNFYKEFIKAYLNYETTAKCNNENYADMLTTILYYEFPLFEIDAEFNSITGYNKNTNTITWNYTKTKKEHDRLIKEFTDNVEYYLSFVNEKDSEQIKAEKLYHVFCTNMKYNYDGKNTRNNISAYYAFTDKKGICTTFAIALSELMNQVRIESTIVSGTNGEDHVWNLFSIDSVNYFADPTFELNWKNGTAFAYFGMTLNDLLDNGFEKKSMSFGAIDIKTIDDIKISNRNLQIIDIN